jgi:hypothetical protein
VTEIPPDDQRCQGIYGEKYRQRPELRGQRCEQPKRPGTDYCLKHNIPDERRCTANYSKNNTDPEKAGHRCVCWAMKGQNVCGIHGGKAPKSLAAAERRLAEADLEVKVTKTLAKLDVGPVENPLTALSQLAGQVVAWQEALADRVNALTDIRYLGGAGEQLRAEVALYERAMDRCNTVLGTIARLNIDERLMKIEEKKAAVFMEAIQAGLVAAGLTPEQTTRAKQVIAQKLRAVRAA